MADLTPSIIFFAILGGVLPALFWLWFWLKEDRLHPEPRGLIVLAFLAGMLATATAYPLEKYLGDVLAVSNNLDSFRFLFVVSVVEESLKYFAIYFVALRSRFFDEPIDAVVYFVTIALGFAALENTLYLISPLGSGDAFGTIMLGNFRFIGATLLHVAASSILGVTLAMTFFASRIKRIGATILALAGAIGLHTLFNFTIIATEGRLMYLLFVLLWFSILALLLACEKIKRLAPRERQGQDGGNVVRLPAI